MSSPDPQVRASDDADIRPEPGDSAHGVRQPRNPAVRGPVIAVTGAASGVGAALVARLAASEEVKQVVAIDERRGDCADAQWHVLDVRDPAIAEKLRGADVVVHLALDLDLESDPAARTAYNVRGTQTVLTAAAAAGVHRVVLCTSAMVYGALPDNDIPLSEDSELRATAEATGVGDLLEIERLGRRAPRAHPGLNVTVVRPAVLVGGTDTALTRYFESPRLLVVTGSRPTWQFCHVEDLVSALEYAALEKVEGELAVGCEGWLEQEEVEELSGIRRMELPSAVALGAAARLHRIGLTPSPAGDLAYTMHPWVVSVSGLHAAGWRPRWTNEEVLAELLQEVAGRHTVAGRRLGRKDAATAAGAAGATVALLGAAAAVRRARKRRGI
ncbi:SDR family oxidoreductase [Streptomyces sp. H27-S2]|uniref:SDR family oxidoreductase n=1 Tax=Streptomyces antarcticus TaxID=2996458 RepID=UPI003B63F4D7